MQEVFSDWLSKILTDEPICAAVDGKTSRQGFHASGHPVQMLNVFAADLKACLGQWPLSGDKKTEPEVLKAHLSEWFDKYPTLRLITGDARYAPQNLAEILVESNHDYLFQLKGNQPDVLDAAKTALADKKDSEADAVKREKKGGRVETRFLWINILDAQYVRERLGFSGCRILLRIERRKTVCTSRKIVGGTKIAIGPVVPG